MSKHNDIRYILGIQSFANQDSGASIVKFSTDGKILDYVAISEERLIREKYPYVFPVFSIGYCMDHFGLKSLNDIDLMVTDYIRIKRWFRSGPAYNTSEFDYLKLKFDIDLSKIRITGHHMAHAAATYHASGFKDAAILIVDGNGSDLETTSYFRGRGQQVKFLENYKAHGIGACYSAVTKQILNFGTGGEGKTMGLAPYGQGHKKVLNIKGKLDGIKNDFSNFMRRMPYSDILNQMDEKYRLKLIKGNYKKCVDHKDLLNPYFSRVAYDIQEETERSLIHLANDLRSKVDSDNICIAGGVGLNSVSNKIILDKCGFKNIFVLPACSDAGIPFGLAIWGYYHCPDNKGIKKKKLNFKNTYTGINYSDNYILKVLKKYNIPFAKPSLHKVAQKIADGNIVAWHQGGSEYGPRALGHRSIVADSRRKEMKDIINLRVKHREAFRPFAPAILEEYNSKYFDLDCESPYMLLIADVKEPDVIPSITHVDNTARVQTVTREANDLFYDLISEFHKITGVPCVLNTSFNDAGEPIVETPEDSIMCFLACDMDYLMVGKYFLKREDINIEKVLSDMQKDRTKKISNRRASLIKKYFKGYDEQEKLRFIEESNKEAEWYVKYKCKFELEQKALEWIEKKKKVLIVGTKDHTAILAKYINLFASVDVVGFSHYKKCYDQKKTSKVPYKTMKIENVTGNDFDEILISSFEYNFEIEQYLKELNIKKPFYSIYDNTSRSFLDIFSDEFPQYKAA
jgi:carbamoyltransferase